MENSPQKKAKKLSPSILVGAICFVVALGILVFPFKKETPRKIDLSEYSSVKAICELATLRSYYHNVVVCEAEPSDAVRIISTVMLWPFDKLAKTGYKQFWLEYSGIVETGIEANQIQIGSPSADGVVEVYVPEARVLNVYADENSLSEPLTEKGLFTTITGEEQAQAFAAAQSEMRAAAENDRNLLDRARDNARKLLEQYIESTGKVMGVEYSVKWVNNPV